MRKGIRLQLKVTVGAISQLVARLFVTIASNEVIVVLLTRVKG